MPKRSHSAFIRLRGVRHNNLKNFDLDLPTGKLIAITGLSGSGKSSLAFDTLFAEGQRRYIETFSPYARQFFDRMDKPQVDRIDGIPPAIAIEQRNAVKTTRSTVGTMTELCEYMKLLWPHLARLYCRGCGKPVEKDSPQSIWEKALGFGQQELLVTFDVSLSEKLSLEESLLLITKQGYQRLLHDGEVVRIEAAAERLKGSAAVTIIQDRLKITKENRARFIEACEQAYHFGKGRLALRNADFQSAVSQASSLQGANLGYPGSAGVSPATHGGASRQDAGAPRIQTLRFSKAFHCADCDIEYREPVSAMFSFNNPVGACVTCRGFGRTISIDYNLAIPDRTKTLAEGVIKPWQTGHGLESQNDLMKFCRIRHVPTDVPFEQLEPRLQNWVIDGDPDYGKDARHEWPHAWYGVKGYFRWLESKAYKMHVRVLLSRYRCYTPCPDCQGQRLQPESLLYKMRDADEQFLNLADFYKLPIERALQLIERICASRPAKAADPIALALNEVRSRVGYLLDVGLGYLTLDRPTRSLSGGETERVNLTTCLGTRLVNTLFVLDEPSVGLHARDTARLVRILEKLRDTGNTVVVVEHEPGVMRAADQIVDLGPGHGESGGQVVFQGSYRDILRSKESLTGQYLAKSRDVGESRRRECSSQTLHLLIEGATCHNLQNLSVRIPLNRFVCLTGVSGSGKTTFVREILQPALEQHLKRVAQASSPAGESGVSPPVELDECAFRTPHSALNGITGWQQIGRVIMVDQSALGRTPRSNPAVYIGAFDDIREIFAQTELAQQRGLSASAFSFNSAQGQCERCRGAGFEKIEMQFLSDVYIRCPECNGRRYRPHILEVKLRATLSAEYAVRSAKSKRRVPGSRRSKSASIASAQQVRDWSIADLLDATVDEAIQVLLSFFHTTPGRRALQSLKLLQELGLGYLRLGQPINTLSGGESQRLKLASHMAEFMRKEESASQRTLFLFDEPTTGLHFDDIRILLQAFQRLVDEGHSVLVIEHNLDLIRAADWIIDLGPEAGEGGGKVVVEGTPEDVARCKASHTGRALREQVEINGLRAVA